MAIQRFTFSSLQMKRHVYDRHAKAVSELVSDWKPATYMDRSRVPSTHKAFWCISGHIWSKTDVIFWCLYILRPLVTPWLESGASKRGPTSEMLFIGKLLQLERLELLATWRKSFCSRLSNRLGCLSCWQVGPSCAAVVTDGATLCCSPSSRARPSEGMAKAPWSIDDAKARCLIMGTKLVSHTFCDGGAKGSSLSSWWRKTQEMDVVSKKRSL